MTLNDLLSKFDEKFEQVSISYGDYLAIGTPAKEEINDFLRQEVTKLIEEESKEIDKKFYDKAFRFITGIIGEYGKPLSELRIATLGMDIEKLTNFLIYQCRKEILNNILGE